MTIVDFIRIGKLKVIPLNPDNKMPVFKWKDHPESFTDDINHLREYWRKGNTAFAFIPARHDLVILDIDIKHGINGLLNLDHYITDKEIIFPYDLNNMPFYVKTPSGGFHFYFKYSGSYLLNTSICMGVEIKHTTLITAPGSKNRIGQYTAYGDFSNIPLIPYALIRNKVKREFQYKLFKHYFQDNKSTSLDKIHNIITRQSGHPTPGNRNIFCFRFSRYAGNAGFSFDEIKRHLSQIVNGDFPERELDNTIKSGMKGKCI